MPDKNWPSWRYGPNGEGQIFQREADVPQGWVDSPSKLPPAPEKLGGELTDTDVSELNNALREKMYALQTERDEMRAENDGLRETNDALVLTYEQKMVQMLDELGVLRAENVQRQQKLRHVTELLARKEVELSDLQRLREGRHRGSASSTLPAADPQSAVRRPRKLSAAKAEGTPFTPADESVTLDEGRAERIKVLREAGVEVSDDITDGEIEEALDWLEKQKS
jgi:hypothetical protein